MCGLWEAQGPPSLPAHHDDAGADAGACVHVLNCAGMACARQAPSLLLALLEVLGPQLDVWACEQAAAEDGLNVVDVVRS